MRVGHRRAGADGGQKPRRTCRVGTLAGLPPCGWNPLARCQQRGTSCPEVSPPCASPLAPPACTTFTVQGLARLHPLVPSTLLAAPQTVGIHGQPRRGVPKITLRHTGNSTQPSMHVAFWLCGRFFFRQRKLKFVFSKIKHPLLLEMDPHTDHFG